MVARPDYVFEMAEILSPCAKAATEAAEQMTGRAIMPQTWELTLDAFPDALELTRVPVASVTSLKYFDATGTEQTLSNGHGFPFIVLIMCSKSSIFPSR